MVQRASYIKEAKHFYIVSVAENVSDLNRFGGSSEFSDVGSR